jgi:hypothetical protein
MDVSSMCWSLPNHGLLLPACPNSSFSLSTARTRARPPWPRQPSSPPSPFSHLRAFSRPTDRSTAYPTSRHPLCAPPWSLFIAVERCHWCHDSRGRVRVGSPPRASSSRAEATCGCARRRHASPAHSLPSTCSRSTGIRELQCAPSVIRDHGLRIRIQEKWRTYLWTPRLMWIVPQGLICVKLAESLEIHSKS